MKATSCVNCGLTVPDQGYTVCDGCRQIMSDRIWAQDETIKEIEVDLKRSRCKVAKLSLRVSFLEETLARANTRFWALKLLPMDEWEAEQEKLKGER